MSQFILGVLDVFAMKESNDLVTIGRCKGTIKKGESVMITNPGEDDNKAFSTRVVSMELPAPSGKGWVKAEKASDCVVSLRLENAAKYKTKKASVVYNGGSTNAEIHDVYISALGDSFIVKDDLAIKDIDAQKFSLTDLAELCGLYQWYRDNKLKERTVKDKEENDVKLFKLVKLMREKLFAMDKIYCLYSKVTGEPFMFSRTIKKKKDYICMPPNIRLITEATLNDALAKYPNDIFEIKCIENGDDKRGIYDFLGSAFYLNGAMGCEFINEAAVISSETLVPKPDFTDADPKKVPVMNPGVERWLLLISQMPMPDTEEKKAIFHLYYSFLMCELPAAKFLIPMKFADGVPEVDAAGKGVLAEKVKLSIATEDGRGSRDAARLYTDWKRFHMVYHEGWEALVQSLGEVITLYDVVINSTERTHSSIYIDMDTFGKITEFLKSKFAK